LSPAARSRGGAGENARRAIVGRVIVAIVVIAAVVFAVQGGEFSTFDLLRQRREKARITASIDSSQRVVDSLKRYEDKVLHDPATQERIAREVFGMVRGEKELLYRFSETPDSAVTDTSKRPPA
jgi:cell division protein FtsB